MIEKIINKKLVNSLSCIQKNEIPNLKNLEIITRLGTKIGCDKEKKEFTKLIENNDHPNVQKQKELFKNATKIL